MLHNFQSDGYNICITRKKTLNCRHLNRHMFDYITKIYIVYSVGVVLEHDQTITKSSIISYDIFHMFRHYCNVRNDETPASETHLLLPIGF